MPSSVERALRAAGEMCAEFGITCVDVTASERGGLPHAFITPGGDGAGNSPDVGAELRRQVDAIAGRIGGTVAASFSRGPLWNVWAKGRLPGGTGVHVWQRVHRDAVADLREARRREKAEPRA